MRRMVILLLVMVVAATVLVAQQAPPGKDRVSGKVARMNPEKSMLVVLTKSKIEETVLYTPTTQWTQGGKPVDMKEFKDNSNVVCIGKFNEKKELNATRCELAP